VVINTSDTESKQEITLYLNNSIAATKQVTLAGNSREPLSFTIKASATGTQTITLGNQSLQVQVKGSTQTTPLVYAKKIYGYLIGALIGIGVGLVVLVLIFVLKKPWRKK
jgi:archaellum component FlaG (FlaF/FlaG flagellin family)